MVEVNDQIADLRSNTTLPPEEIGKRLEGLYRQKLTPGEIQPAEPNAAEPATLESINEKILDIRYDEKINPEKKGEFLAELYWERLSLERAEQAQPEDPQAISREVTNELMNTWGSHYQPNIDAIAKVIADAFGDDVVPKFEAFSKTLNMTADDNIDTMHHLADLAAPVKSEMDIEDCNIVVADRLRGMWGSAADERFELAQRAAKGIFGSLEKCNEFLIARGLHENPQQQIKAMILLSRLGGKMKTERA